MMSLFSTYSSDRSPDSAARSLVVTIALQVSGDDYSSRNKLRSCNGAYNPGSYILSG